MKQFAATRQRCLAATVAFVSAGCSPAIHSTRYVQAPAQPADHEIRIYSMNKPECPFEELGHVTGRQRNRFISMDKVVESLRQRARELGGDAIVGVQEKNDVQGGAVLSGGGVIVNRDPEIGGTVIRFTKADCTK